VDEVFPVLAGIVLGLVVLPLRSKWAKIFAFGVFSLALGAAASWINGELSISWGYVFIDAAQVLAAGVMTSAAVRLWRRRGWWRTS